MLLKRGLERSCTAAQILFSTKGIMVRVNVEITEVVSKLPFEDGS